MWSKLQQTRKAIPIYLLTLTVIKYDNFYIVCTPGFTRTSCWRSYIVVRVIQCSEVLRHTWSWRLSRYVCSPNGTYYIIFTDSLFKTTVLSCSEWMWPRQPNHSGPTPCRAQKILTKVTINTFQDQRNTSVTLHNAFQPQW